MMHECECWVNSTLIQACLNDWRKSKGRSLCSQSCKIRRCRAVYLFCSPPPTGTSVKHFASCWIELSYDSF